MNIRLQPPRARGPRVRLRLPAIALLAAAAGCVRRPPPPKPNTRLRVAVPYSLSTLDPQAEATAGGSLLRNVYEPLVTIDASFHIRPALAESWLNPDDLTWIFHLRRGVRFQDGRPLEAADVTYSFERLLNDGHLDASYYAVDVSSVEALDDYTVRIRTRSPAPILLNRLNWIPVIPRGSTAESFLSGSHGTGPYRVAGWPDDRLDLDRFDGYRGAVPQIASASVFMGRSRSQELAGLVSGQYDLALVGPQPPDGPLARSRRFDLLESDSLHVKYLGFDLARQATPFCPVHPNPFLDLRVRQAIHAAIDRRALAAAVGGDAVPASQLVTRFVFGFDPALPEPPHAPAKARALLRKAGLGGGFEVTLHTRPVLEPAARVVAAQLAEVGIRTDVRVLPDPAYFRGLEQHAYSFWLDRWGCTTGDAGELFENAMHSTDPARRLGLFNETGFESPSLDRQIEQAAALPGLLERRLALQALMGRLMHELVWIPLYSDKSIGAVSHRYLLPARVDLPILLAEIHRR